jgi:hypothetical protein
LAPYILYRSFNPNIKYYVIWILNFRAYPVLFLNIDGFFFAYKSKMNLKKQQQLNQNNNNNIKIKSQPLLLTMNSRFVFLV